MIAALALGFLTSVGAATMKGGAGPDDAPAVRVTLNGPNVYDPGDRARVHVQVRDDSYLIVLQAAPDGSVSVLFPRLPGDDNLVHGGTEFDIQGGAGAASFVVSPAGGQGMVYAAVSKDPYHFDAFVANGSWNTKVFPDTANRNSEATLTALVQQMLNPDGRFDYDLANYTVTRNAPRSPSMAYDQGGAGSGDQGVGVPDEVVYVYNDPWVGPWFNPWYDDWGYGGVYALAPWYYGYAPFVGVGLGVGFIEPTFYGGFYGGGFAAAYPAFYGQRPGWRAPVGGSGVFRPGYRRPGGFAAMGAAHAFGGHPGFGGVFGAGVVGSRVSVHTPMGRSGVVEGLGRPQGVRVAPAPQRGLRYGMMGRGYGASPRVYQSAPRSYQQAPRSYRPAPRSQSAGPSQSPRASGGGRMGGGGGASARGSSGGRGGGGGHRR